MKTPESMWRYNALHKAERAMHHAGCDACLVVRDTNHPPKRDANYWRGFKLCEPSKHRYDYSMGIGDALIITVPAWVSAGRLGEPPVSVRARAFGNAYNYGMTEPNYPVPATIKEVEILPDRVILWERSGTHITPGFQQLFPHYLAY